MLIPDHGLVAIVGVVIMYVYRMCRHQVLVSIYNTL